MQSGDFAQWVADARTAFESAQDLESLKNARLAHLGDKSLIAGASRSLASADPSQKAQLGKAIGEAKTAIAKA